MKQTISVLGPSTYSEESALWFLQKTGYELVPFKTITEVFEATVSGRTAYGVIPVENTIEGSVSLHIDWLVHHVDLPIQVEWVFPISVHLMMLPEDSAVPVRERRERLSSIRKVLSHPVALAQSRKYLVSELPDAENEPVASTAEGARLVKERGDPAVAAVGPASAAKHYGLDIVADDVQDHNNNYTRFTLVGQDPFPLERLQASKRLGWKTTLLLMPDEDLPGGLHQLLSAFAWRRLNLTKIESRPTKRALGTYYFYVDVEASIESVLLQGAIEEVRAVGCQVRVMGSYPSYGYTK